ncbi:hypothetical protein Pint_01897 [Pistacia integerrima]|uniref:Uncharacterized protein n=1 Tax=Pistacia integerrima TaxID=434235 RepID=A0ACC0ZIW5_9ROSI|nr:hypothetical protein Pint_01897 [Pistacia integerrima]
MEFRIYKVVFGFGFHPTTKEYKVVKIIYYRARPLRVRNLGGIFPPTSQVQIFTLGSLTWRSLGNISYSIFQRSPQVLVGGRLHWPKRDGPGRSLISFDLADEQFRVVPQPDCGGLDSCSFSLAVLGGCLSAAVRRNYGQLEIWVTKDYDVKESRTKEFSVGIHVPRGLRHDVAISLMASKFYYNSTIFRVLCLMKNGNILLERKGRGLVAYNPISGTLKELLFNGMSEWFEAVVHKGNLTLIDT